VILDRQDRRRLAGGEGDALRLATRLLAETGAALGAERLIPIASAHVAGCFYTGQVGLDFADRLVAAGARVAVPTTLNTGAVDLVHPELNRGDPETSGRARRLMERYAAMGCRTTWTCAPYQVGVRPARGQDVAWGESNAVVFANSVLGARTNRYGDFIDIAAAIAGRVPDTGLHRDENRRGEILFRLNDVPARLLGEDVLYPVLGHLVGRATGAAVPVLDGLAARTPEHRLKALGAAAAASGGVGLFHAVGLTPEAPTAAAALGGRAPRRTVDVTTADLVAARDSLSTAPADGRLTTVCLGTPHFSIAEFDRLTPLVAGVAVHPDVDFYVSTSRAALDALRERGELACYERAGIRLVVDTCTYFPGVLAGEGLRVMTNSAKWAYYAPGNLGVEVVFGSLEECVRSAGEGVVWRDERLWR
jgi:predicted aconitase